MSVGEFVTDGPLLLAMPVAAAAGLLSFLSPCVLPLVPGYLSFVTGLTGEDLEAGASCGGTAGRPGGNRQVASHAPTASYGPTAVSTARSLATTTAVPAGAVHVGAGPVGALPIGAGSGGAGSVPAGSGHSGAATAVCATVPAAAAGTPRVVARVFRRGRVVVGTGLFVLGFTAVFVSYGAAFGGLGQWLTSHQVGVGQVLGAVTIVMGLAFAGVFSRMSWANREWRIHRLPPPGLLGAPVLGVLFGLGWTPCLGPTLSAVLGLAVQSATATRGAVLSAVYCLGLGIPFFIVGLAFRRSVGALAVVRSHARMLTVVGGGMLVAVGLLQVTGLWADLIAEMRTYTPGFSETPL